MSIIRVNAKDRFPDDIEGVPLNPMSLQWIGDVGNTPDGPVISYYDVDEEDLPLLKFDYQIAPTLPPGLSPLTPDKLSPFSRRYKE